jgi:hypothetical protein
VREDKFFHIFCKADQASKQDHRISGKILAPSSASVTLGMRIIPKVSLAHSELLFGSFGFSTACKPHVSFMEVRTMNNDLMLSPWSDEWTDIGGEG